MINVNGWNGEAIASYSDLEQAANTLAVIAEQGEALSLALAYSDNLDNLELQTIETNFFLLNNLFTQLKVGTSKIQGIKSLKEEDKQ